MDQRRYDHLEQAIQDLGSPSSFMRAPVRQAKDDARAALAAFQQQPLPPGLRRAATLLGERLEAIQIHQPALDWPLLLQAWETLEREAAGEAQE